MLINPFEGKKGKEPDREENVELEIDEDVERAFGLYKNSLACLFLNEVLTPTQIYILSKKILEECPKSRLLSMDGGMFTELIQTCIGIECDIKKLKILGERIFMIKRLFNLKMGIFPKDDRLPKILLNPLEGTDSAGKSPNFEQLKNEYYKYREWDIESGKINKEKLKKVGLEKL